MVYKSKYSWKDGYKPKVSAEIVGTALAKLKDGNEEGVVNAAMLLDYSRPEESETHDLFEWNDNAAAEKWRLYQSGRIINQLEVELIPIENKVTETDVQVITTPIESLSTPIKTHAYWNIEPKGPAKQGIYMDAQTAFSNHDTRRKIMQQAYRDFKALECRYSNIKELATVFEAIHAFGMSIDDNKG